jgi:hypothetical protein
MVPAMIGYLDPQPDPWHPTRTTNLRDVFPPPEPPEPPSDDEAEGGRNSTSENIVPLARPE